MPPLEGRESHGRDLFRRVFDTAVMVLVEFTKGAQRHGINDERTTVEYL